MEVFILNERLALLREILGLTTRKFGEKLNITGGAVTNMEKGTRNITDRTISDICREFNVNEEWLRNGKGDVFIEPDTFSLDEYLKQQGATELEMEIIKGYFNIPKEIRGTVLDYFKNIILPAIQKK
jgi:transcriptional regulator with XRE-family HTH domain